MFYPFYDSGMCFFPEKMMEAYKAETFTGEGKTLFIYFFGMMGTMMGHLAMVNATMRLPTARMADVASGSSRASLISTEASPRIACALVPLGGAFALRSLTTKCLKPSLPLRAASQASSSAQHTYLYSLI